MKLRKLSLAFPLVCAAAATGLTGCGDGSDDIKDTIEEAAQPTTISGVAIDGRLQNALVCIDSNRTKTCDSDESPVSTDSLGAYLFSTTDTTSPLLATVDIGTTFDIDTKQTINQYFFLSAPPESTVITPLTTLVQVRYEQLLASDSTTSIDSVQSVVATELGIPTTTDLTTFNYIENTDDTAKTVALQARVITDAIATNILTAQSATLADSSLQTTRNILDAAVDSLFADDETTTSVLDQIKTTVDTIITNAGDLSAFDVNSADAIQATQAAISSVDLISVADIEAKLQQVNTNNANSGQGPTGAPDDPVIPTGATGGTGG